LACANVDRAISLANETIVGLLDAPPVFKPERGSALTFLAHQVRHAARCVRAHYTGPGQRTRLSKKNVDATSADRLGPVPRMKMQAQVGVRHVDERVWLVTFRHYDLGYFDDETCRLEPIANPFGPTVLPMSPE
jgi:putative hemolysin